MKHMKERILYYLRKSVEKMVLALLWIVSLVADIANDTLKKDGKWSRTSLTMFSAWLCAIVFALYDLNKNGFHFEVFLTFVGVALGSKLVDAQSKRLEQ
jgi:hypothetical protein